MDAFKDKESCASFVNEAAKRFADFTGSVHVEVGALFWEPGAFSATLTGELSSELRLAWCARFGADETNWDGEEVSAFLFLFLDGVRLGVVGKTDPGWLVCHYNPRSNAWRYGSWMDDEYGEFLDMTPTG